MLTDIVVFQVVRHILISSGGTRTVNITLSLLPTGVVHNISLQTGYQFVSRNVQPANVDMEYMLNGGVNGDDISGNLDFVRNTAGTQLPPWTNSYDWEKEEGIY